MMQVATTSQSNKMLNCEWYCLLISPTIYLCIVECHPNPIYIHFLPAKATFAISRAPS
jgi:hypothetical protein